MGGNTGNVLEKSVLEKRWEISSFKARMALYKERKAAADKII